jgi:hypothetical protein
MQKDEGPSMRAVNDNLATPLRLVDGVKMWIWTEGAPMLVQRAVSEGWEGAARCPSCSQNAHDETVLVPYAQ